MERKYPTPIKQIIESVLKAQHLEEGILKVRAVNLLGELLGPQIKNATTSVYVKDCVLFVSVRSSIVRNELLLLKSKIIEKMNEELGHNYLVDIVIH